MSEVKNVSGNCPNLERLAGWIEGSLPETERPALAAHLADCDDCRRSVELAVLAIDSKVEPLAPGAEERWLRVIRRPRARTWSWAAAAAVFLAVAVLAIAKLRSDPTPPAVPPTADQPTKKEEPRVTPTHEKKPEEPNVRLQEIVKLVPPIGEKLPDELVEAPKIEDQPRIEEPNVKRDTKVDLSGNFEAIGIVDGSGDLWIRKAEGEEFAKLDGTSRAGYGQLIESRKNPAAFTVDGSATVAIEPDTKVWVARAKGDQGYALSIDRGVAFLDTEGMRQAWQFFSGASSVLMPQVHGRVFVQAMDEAFQVWVLQGKVEVLDGTDQQTMESGRSFTVDRTGKPQPAKAESAMIKKSLERLYKIRPTSRTVFSANFDEVDPKTFPYTITLGSTRRDTSPKVLQYVIAEGATGAMVAKMGGKSDAGIGLKLGREVTYLNGMVIRFKYKTNVSTLEIRAGKFAGRVSVKATDGKWMTAEIPIEILEEEGVPIVSGDSLQEVFFNLPKDSNRVGTLEIDGVELIRSARFAK